MAKPNTPAGNGPAFTGSYYFKKETPGTWVYDLRGPDGKTLGSLYVPKAIAKDHPGPQLRADFYKVK